jgi:hypothetical protein
MTIHKVSTKLKQFVFDYYLDLDHIFVDEVSMLGQPWWGLSLIFNHDLEDKREY